MATLERGWSKANITKKPMCIINVQFEVLPNYFIKTVGNAYPMFFQITY
jgi:hypothetical protein